MIRVTAGTTYITAEAFRDRYLHARPGTPFQYATGNLSMAGALDDDALDLRLQVDHLVRCKKIAAECLPCGLLMPDGTYGFAYRATRLA